MAEKTNNKHLQKSFIKVKKNLLKGDVTREDPQRRFLAQHSVATLLRHCFEKLQPCSNTAMPCCAKIVVANRPV